MILPRLRSIKAVLALMTFSLILGCQSVSAEDLTDGGGFENICAVINGGAWCLGTNLRGLLGINQKYDFKAPSYTSTPKQVLGLGYGVEAISSGHLSTCVIKDGGVWCWGAIGCSGSQLEYDRLLPTPIEGLSSGVTAISGNCAIQDGGVVCWDEIECNPNNPNSKCADNNTCIIPRVLENLEKGVDSISTFASFGSRCAVKDGGLWCWDIKNEKGRPVITVPSLVPGFTENVTAVRRLQCQEGLPVATNAQSKMGTCGVGGMLLRSAQTVNQHEL